MQQSTEVELHFVTQLNLLDVFILCVDYFLTNTTLWTGTDFFLKFSLAPICAKKIAAWCLSILMAVKSKNKTIKEMWMRLHKNLWSTCCLFQCFKWFVLIGLGRITRIRAPKIFKNIVISGSLNPLSGHFLTLTVCKNGFGQQDTHPWSFKSRKSTKLDVRYPHSLET